MTHNRKEVYGFIFARGGSKGLKNKNLKKLSGKSLLGWSIDHAKSVSKINRIIISTDSEKIAAEAKKYGAEILFKRPKYLSSDKSPEWLAWQHALNFLKKTENKIPEIMVSIPPTAPLRNSKDIERCINKLIKNDIDIAITVSDSFRNPWFNMVRKNNKNLSELINKPNKKVFRRQDAPKTYDMTTVAYAAYSKFVLENDSIFSGKVGQIEIPKHRAIDIDDIIDFKIAEALLKIKR
ncbi:MAG: acylneuraminate cytidylyltransferase [Gammaproteobacteria bacterium]|nr:acylneuraminate cytidylyltransferase [Gammaproteobacteria bacterium]RCL41289.1 MAG: acylneuraminate cytidylyltransferase family protein [Gammaproteobacteria bacterium]|tara:strand:- start:6607 stop:7317 length:711 start_codon:yes stop_codon:yes gene_type:complete